MNCHEVSGLLEAMHDGALSPRARAVVESHTASCAACRAELDRLRALSSLLGKLPAPAPPASLDKRLMLAFRRRHEPRPSPFQRLRRALAGSVAVPKPALALSLVAVAAAVVLGVELGRITATPIQLAPAQPASFAPAPADVRTIEVPVEHVRIVRVKTQAPSRPAATPKPRPAADRQPAPSPAAGIESFTTLSASGANYTTKASLEGFVPSVGSTARLIKGGEKQ